MLLVGLKTHLNGPVGCGSPCPPLPLPLQAGGVYDITARIWSPNRGQPLGPECAAEQRTMPTK